MTDSTNPDELQRCSIYLCSRCLDGEGGECHTPGCALWMNRAPDVPIRSRIESVEATTSDNHVAFPMITLTPDDLARALRGMAQLSTDPELADAWWRQFRTLVYVAQRRPGDRIVPGEERASIVAWLRWLAGGARGRGVVEDQREFLLELADAIEHGEHRRERDNGCCDNCGSPLLPGSEDPASGILLCPGGCNDPV